MNKQDETNVDMLKMNKDVVHETHVVEQEEKKKVVRKKRVKKDKK